MAKVVRTPPDPHPLPQHPLVADNPPMNRNHVIHLKKRNLKAPFSLQTILPGIGEQFDNISEWGEGERNEIYRKNSKSN